MTERQEPPMFDPPLPEVIDQRPWTPYERDSWNKMVEIEHLLAGLTQNLRDVPDRLTRLERGSDEGTRALHEMRSSSEAAARQLKTLELRGKSMEERFSTVESRLADVEGELRELTRVSNRTTAAVEQCTASIQGLTQTCLGVQATTRTLYDRVFQTKEASTLPQVSGEVVDLRPQPPGE